jgi:two-component system, OmpR family, response regulator
MAPFGLDTTSEVDKQKMPTVVIIDDDNIIATILSEALATIGVSSIIIDKPFDIFKELNSRKIDLVTLDLSLDTIDGFKLLRDILCPKGIPVVIISSKSADQDRIRGLEYGAVDYIVKPFHIKEFILRVQVALKRTFLAGRFLSLNQIVLDDYIFIDTHRREVKFKSNDLIELTSTEYNLLDYFICFSNMPLTRDELYKSVLERTYTPLDRTLDGHVARLRSKLKDGEDSRPRRINSIRNTGYIFSAIIKRY